MVAYKEVVPNVWSKDAYGSLRRNKRIATTCRGGRGCSVELIYDDCKPSYQAKMRASLPELDELLRSRERQGEPVLSLNDLTARELEICQARYTLVMEYRKYVERNKDKNKGLLNTKREFIDLVTCGMIHENAYKVISSLSFATIERWDKKLRDNNNLMSALAPERKSSNMAPTSLSDDQQTTLLQLLMNHYCTPNQPTLADTLRFVECVFKAKGLQVPSESRCRRFMNEWIQKNEALVVARRKGVKAMKDNYMPFIDRDPDSIRFMDVFVADGHVMNFQVEYTVQDKSGREIRKVGRPTMIGWQDMRTGNVMGFELMMTENTMCVASSFRLACMNAAVLCGSSNAAALPRMVYLDNGRAFKNKFFNEEINLENSVGGLFEQLKAFGFEGVQYALPYNAQTKTIERSWRNFLEVEKQAIHYTGDSIDNKPAYLARNETWHREAHAEELNQKGMLTLQGAYAMIARWIAEYNNRAGSGKYLNGYTPVQLAQLQLPEVDFGRRIIGENELNYMIMQRKTCTIRRNGLKINGAWYYNAREMAMLPKGEIDVLVKYDMFHTDKVFVFHTDGSYWCEAGYFIGNKVHAMYKLGSEVEQRRSKAAIGEVQRIIHTASNMAKNLNGGTVIDWKVGELDIHPKEEKKILPEYPEDDLSDIRMF